MLFPTFIKKGKHFWRPNGLLKIILVDPIWILFGARVWSSPFRVQKDFNMMHGCFLMQPKIKTTNTI